ncbi:class I adenylate-forming enzyme family protein [Haliscomenobacter hydrossis]|uniref:O-succinylbenzoate--CoA ligase n=1 Tax=Haliscomenobacter hydrossis (strain ATCC 27775 / DSM 1100 / LMG 10767 / O) TaxID=760192 RepID=F4L6H9_HALH1|nr:long-chain fatty acid--CoA ligase [Haliscomenobacter hydrossis]AEE49822.1 o-succinylbenzoate--CoA ligase [Haliscomenobacter hydrossis DSM 1100]
MKDWFSKWALYSPEEIAVKEWETGRTLSYGALDKMANRLAWHLTQDLGLQTGERVAVLADNCLEYIALFAAAQKTGLVLVPLNYRLSSTEIDYLLRDSGPQLLIVEEKYQALVEAAPAWETIPQHWSIELLGEWLDAAVSAPAWPFASVFLEDDHPIFILYTSGTTGFPKGALYTHKMLFWNSINTAMSLVINSHGRTVVCMPPFHTGGWNVLTTPLLHHGGYVCLMKKFDTAEVLKALVEEKPSIFMGVPTMLKMIADCTGFAEADLSSLYYIIVGGEPMPIPLIETWHNKGVFIRQGFGMTEVGPNLFSLHHRDAMRKKGSIGRPNFYVEIKIVDENGQEVAPNTPGELLLRGPMTTPGYWGNPIATASSIREGWFYSGDMLRQDEEGYLYVVDRIKNMFISGGENVYPAEIERVLVAHPQVAGAAVIGVQDEKWGEVGKAFVTFTEGCTLDEVELKTWCVQHLAKFKVPKYFEFLRELPVSATGKIDKKVLR